MADHVDIEKQYKEVQANLKKVGDDLKAYAEEAEKATKAHQALSEESKAKVDELLIKQGELNARLKTAEQIMASGMSGAAGAQMTLGEHVEASDEFRASVSRIRGGRGSATISINAAIINEDPTSDDRRIATPDRVAGIVAPNQQRLFLRDLINWDRTGSNSIEYVRESGFSNAADVVSENPALGKPQSSITLELDHAAIATIAHWIHASRQVLDDVSMLRAHIDGRLRYGLKLKEEAQLLKGSGVGLDINGVFTQAQNAIDLGVSVSDETAIDRLRVAMLQVALAEYSADGIVLNPIDWTQIELLKDGNKGYLLANPQGALVPALWGLPVISTKALDAGEYLAGAFRMGAHGWDRQDVTITVSTEDRDNFIKNMVTILCEERVGLTVFRPEAFVKGDFSAALSSH